MKTLLTGATGLIGRNLMPHLDQVWGITRDPSRAAKNIDDPSVKWIQWASTNRPLSSEEIPDIDCVINLMGESIGEGRWNEEKKKRIRRSRVDGTRRLVDALSGLESLPKVLISGSAVGYYGDRGDDILDETSEAGEDFLAQLCQDWESAAQPLADRGVRVVYLRTGVVLGRNSPAFQKMVKPFRWGVGGKLASGQQWMSWIHLDDIVQLILRAAGDDRFDGPVNATAPQPVRNITFTRQLGEVLSRPTIFRVPRIALRLALGEFADYLLMSQRAEPRVALRNGFEFQYGDLATALSQLLSEE